MTDYIELALLKSELGIAEDDDTRDVPLQLNISAASQAIDDRCGRTFGKTETATTRRVPVSGRVLEVRDRGVYLGSRLITPDIASADGVEVAGFPSATLWPESSFETGQPATGLVLQSGTWAGRLSVGVTAVWGWPAVPATIQQACLLQALRLSRRKGSPEGVAGSAEWGLIRIPNLDPDVRALVEPYRLPGIA